MRELASTTQEAVRAYLEAEVDRHRPGDAGLVDDLSRRLEAGGLAAIHALVRCFRHDDRALSADLPGRPPEAAAMVKNLRARLALSAIAERFTEHHRPEQQHEPALTRRGSLAKARRAGETAGQLAKDGLQDAAVYYRKTAEIYLEGARMIEQSEERLRTMREQARRLGVGKKKSGVKMKPSVSVALQLQGCLGADVHPALPAVRGEDARPLVEEVVECLCDLDPKTLNQRLADWRHRVKRARTARRS